MLFIWLLSRSDRTCAKFFCHGSQIVAALLYGAQYILLVEDESTRCSKVSTCDVVPAVFSRGSEVCQLGRRENSRRSFAFSS